MKKFILLVLLTIVVGGTAIAQTMIIELENLTRRYQEGDFTAEEYTRIAREWREMIDEFGGYPELPFDEEIGKFVHEYVFDLSGATKDEIYDRVNEWAAIVFGDVGLVMRYQNRYTGKIIFKGLFPIEFEGFKTNSSGLPKWRSRKLEEKERTSAQTYIVTIKEGKLKVQVLQIEVKDLNYEPENGRLFPITDNDPVFWRQNLNIMLAIIDRIESDVREMVAYIYLKDADYDF